MNKIVAVILVMISALTLSGCTPTNNSEQEIRSVQSESENQESADLVVIASHMVYSPNRIEVEAGSSITIRIDSQDEVHDFVIDELNVDSGLIRAGGSTTVTIQIPEDASGKTYEFYCSVGSHRAMGMVGDLVVK